MIQSRDIRNATLNTAGEALWGFLSQFIAAATVLAVYLKRLGASDAMVGSLAAVEGGLMVVPQILGNYVFHSRRTRRRGLMLWHFLVILPAIVVMGVLACPYLSLGDEVRRWAMFLGFALFATSAGVVLAAWWDWIAGVFDVRFRGTAMGVSWSAAALAGAGGALAAGEAIARWGECQAVWLLYLAAAAVAYVSIACFWFIDDRQGDTTAETPPPSLAELAGRFRRSLGDRNFRAFLIGRILAVAGFCILPLVTVHYTSSAGGGMAAGSVVSCAAAQTVGMGISGFILGRLGDRLGHRIGVLLGAGAQAAVLALMLLTTGVVSCVAAFFGVGVCVGVNLVSHVNMLFETCRHDHRMAHITIGNLVIALASIGAPLAVAVATRYWALRTIFSACLVVSALSFLWFLLRVKEPREEMVAG